jgi:hypothetical protein
LRCYSKVRNLNIESRNNPGLPKFQMSKQIQSSNVKNSSV